VALAVPELTAKAASAAADVKRRVRKGLVIYFLHWVRGAPDCWSQPSPAPIETLERRVKNINKKVIFSRKLCYLAFDRFRMFA
jgi:hypothetical protein